jgi:TonB-dependent starch-binding outer membrane protein SusC
MFLIISLFNIFHYKNQTIMLLAIMRKSAMLLLAVIGFTAFAAAQTVTGTVTDSKGDPVSGVSVTVKGTTKGTSTNAQGVFTLNDVANGATLVFTGSGFTAQEVKTTGSAVNVTMATSVSNLNEVVVIGYGSARKKDLTGAIGSVKAKDFNQGFVTSPDQLLQNKVAGLEVTNNSGQPGVATTIKIRGNNSIRAVNNPLYVIDGVPLDGRTARPSVNLGNVGFGSTPESNPLLYINPNDIAQVDVLKDASSAAIYGSRGANGVIAITTKRAASGGTKIEFGTSFGTSIGYLKNYEILDAAEFRSALQKYNLGSAGLDKGKTVNALDAITQNNLSSDYNLSISSGNENGKFRASFLASRARGFLVNSNLDKYLGSFSGQYKFFDKKLSIDFNARLGNTKENIANVSNTADSKGNLISSALSWNPTEDFKDANGKFVIPGNGSGNPLAFSKAYSDIAKVNSILADISASYKILSNLEYKYMFAVNTGSGERNTNIDSWLGGYNGISGLGLGVKSFARLTTQTINHTLNYNTNLSSKITLNALAGYEYWKTDYQGSSFSAQGFNTNVNEFNLTRFKYTDVLGNGTVQAPPSIFVNPTSELQSYFGRAILNYSDKYLLTATIRADGSSKFGKDNKYGYFPSFAAKWNISNADFMKGSSLFSNLALRASWGITGNSEFPAGASQDQFGFDPGRGQTVGKNSGLKWESTTAYNIGVDFSFKNGKIYGSLDYYDKNTTDILYESLAIQPAPNATIFVNLPANLKNNGVEFSIGSALIEKNDFSLDVNFNISYNKNILKNFYGQDGVTPLTINTGQINGQGVSGTLSQIITNNRPVNEFFLKKFGGFDANGNQIIANNPEFSGNPNPQTNYGIGINVRYKKFNVTLNAGGAGGFLIYNNTATNITNLAGIQGGRNVDKAAYNSSEKITSSAAASTRFLEKGDFFKLRNMTLRYNVGTFGKYIKGVSAFVSGSNLFVLTKFTGFDPEVNIDKSQGGYPSRSIEYVPYPTPRTLTFGFNVSL